jgi:ABC-type uncharacterized transport system involved in gliding motility auxiliary subunit
MRISRESRRQLRLAGSSFILLFLLAIGLGLWLSHEYHTQFDWTAAGQNSLSETSRLLLQKLDKPVKITAFATEQPELRAGIRNLVGRYQQHYPGITLEFIDPDKDPARVRAANVNYDGELQVEYNGARESLQQPSEETLTNALARLGRGGERWIVFLSGHGERSPDSQANHDLSTWAQQLNKRGLKTRSLLLGENTQIPHNTSTLIIAGPRVKLQPGEVKQITAFLSSGGNLLWLNDPGPQQGLAPLSEMLGIEFEPGVIVDPVSQAFTGGASATFVVVTQYGRHPAVRDFRLTSLFPEAAGIRTHRVEGWNAEMLLDTSVSAWSETGAPDDSARFDQGKDIHGPLSVGVALTHAHEGREQRVLVMGDGDFLSNTYIGNGGNLDLGMNLVNWVSGDDIYLNIPSHTANDIQLDLSPSAIAGIRLFFVILLPLALMSGGMIIWWRRRRR